MKKFISKIIGLYLNTLSILAPKYAGKLGFELFCHPFRTKLTDKHLEFLRTATQSELKIGGETIKWYRWGNGPKKILMLHGWESHTYRWKSYIEALDQEQFTILSIDAPGHGLSTGRFMSVPFYKEAIEKLLVEIGTPEIVIGHSIGGFTGMYTFYLHPDRAPQKFVSLAPPGEAIEFFDFYRLQLGLTSYCTKLVIEHFTQIVGNPPSYFSAPSFVADFNFHGLLIHDEGDDETSVENSRAIHQSWRHSQLIITRGKGHNLKSAEIVNTVVGFVQDSTNAKRIGNLKLVS